MSLPSDTDRTKHEELPGSLDVTIKDVARMAEVSDSTVSMAFRPGSRISPQTREKVLAVARKLHYVPNLNARALRMGALNAIGFLVNDITNPFHAMMVNIAEPIAIERGFQLVVADSHWNPDREVRAIENMIRSRVRGMLICPCEKTRQGLDLLSLYSMPCIAVDTISESYRGAFIGNDLVAAGKMAAEHLLDIGCRRVAFLTAEQQMSLYSACYDVQKGFLATLSKHGVDPDEVPVINAGLKISAGKYGFERLLKRSPEIDGVLCINDLCAMGVIEAADAKGIKVGRDLAVMGIDDLDMSAMARVSLTSIRQPYDRIIELAVNALIDGIEADDAPDVNMTFQPDLVVRSSTCRRK